MAASLVEKAGGLPGLEAVLSTFYDAVFVDPMIGFHFRAANKEHLIRVEAELTARLLGDTNVRYTGRPIGAAHANHPILGGHFERRTELLRQAMVAHDVDAEVQAAWLAHTERLRPLVTRQAGSGCDHPPGAEPAGGLVIEQVPAASGDGAINRSERSR